MPYPMPLQEKMKHRERRTGGNIKIGAISTTLIGMKSSNLTTGALPSNQKAKVREKGRPTTKEHASTSKKKNFNGP